MILVAQGDVFCNQAVISDVDQLVGTDNTARSEKSVCADQQATALDG